MNKQTKEGGQCCPNIESSAIYTKEKPIIKGALFRELKIFT